MSLVPLYDTQTLPGCFATKGEGEATRMGISLKGTQKRVVRREESFFYRLRGRFPPSRHRPLIAHRRSFDRHCSLVQTFAETTAVRDCRTETAWGRPVTRRLRK